MKKITTISDVNKYCFDTSTENILKKYLSKLFNQYKIADISEFGRIFVLESALDFDKFKELGLVEPICKDNFEFVDKINSQGEKYRLGCFILNSDFGVYILSKESVLTEKQLSVFKSNIVNNEFSLEDF